MQKKVNIGDIVSLINDDIKGKVIAINGNEILIEDSDGFERNCHVNDLVVYDSKLSDDRSLSSKHLSNEKPKKNVDSNPDIIDLHNTNIHLPKNRILENQLKLFKTNLNRAIGKRALKIVFIHGKGDGILRSALEKILRKNNIKYGNAPYQKYGQGAIEIYLSGVNLVVR